MTCTLDQFFGALDEYDDRVPLDELQRMLRDLEVDRDELRPFAVFDDEGYRRNLVHRGPACEVLLLCWRNGQRSKIHDHRGSSCAVRVLRGTATETVFERNEKGWIYPTATFHHVEGGVCASNDMDTHQISNLQPHGEDLVTMHVYSPPLAEVGNYSLTDNTVETVVNRVEPAPAAVTT